MNAENTNKLTARFPGFFDVNMDMMESSMCFGFQCGDGWFNLIWELSEKLEQLVGKDFEITTIKEKFGGLRFYPRKYDEKATALIGEYELQSENVCEECGEPSTLKKFKGGNWIYNMCDTCWKRFCEEREQSMRV